MRSDLFALTAAVAGCAVAAPAAQPQWAGSWGSNGGWGSHGGWGGNAPAAGASSAAAGGVAAPTEASPPVASPVYPTGTGSAPVGTGAAPIGTGVAGTGVAVAAAAASSNDCPVVYVDGSSSSAAEAAPVKAAATGVSAAAPALSTGVSAEAPSSNSTTSSASGLTGKSTDAKGLNALFVAKGKQYFGTCADPGTLGSSETVDIINADFGQITPENSMKWDALEATRGKFTFDTADKTAAFAAENGKMLRCHTLVWHSQLPDWVKAISDKTELTEVIENHIAEVAGHFKGKCFAWVSYRFHRMRRLIVKLTIP